MATYKAVVLKGGRHLKEDGTSNIKIRLYHNGGVQYLPTPYYIKPMYMTPNGEVSQFFREYEALTFELTQLIQTYREASMRLGTDRLNRMTASDLRDELMKCQQIATESIDFIKFGRSLARSARKKRTGDWYDYALNSFCSYIEKESFDIRELTSNRIKDYVRFLSERRVVVGGQEQYLEPGTINNYLRALRAIFNKAKDHYNNEEYSIYYIQNSPFERVSIPKYRRKRKNVSIDTIIKLRDAELRLRRPRFARDIFLMQFYLMGINIGDLFRLTNDNIRNGRIEYMRSKTDTDDGEHFPLSIKIEPELQELIDRYSCGSFLSEVHDRYSNHHTFMQGVNKGLKQAAEELCIGERLSTNWARHSWASIARNKAGVSKADIDFCLGHVNNDYKMADIYIDIDYIIFDKANRKVLDLLKKDD